MSRIHDDQTAGRAEQLGNELKAIELWDAVYKRNLFPFWYDHGAFVSRQRRRGEITSELQRMNAGNVYASHPVSSTDVSQGQSEDTVRVVGERRPPQSSHDRHQGKQSGTLDFQY
jgi:hypothetical protein